MFPSGIITGVETQIGQGQIVIGQGQERGIGVTEIETGIEMIKSQRGWYLDKVIERFILFLNLHKFHLIFSCQSVSSSELCYRQFVYGCYVMITHG